MRGLDKFTQLAVDLLMFVVPSLLSTVLYWGGGDVRADLLAASVVEALVTLGFAARVVVAVMPGASDGPGCGVGSASPACSRCSAIWSCLCLRSRCCSSSGCC